MQLRFLLLAGVLGSLSLRPALSQTAPTSTVSSARLCFDPVALSPDDASLKTPISLDAHRMPLAEFARQLSHSAHITLALPPELATRPITAHLETQPLGETMRALSRLYGLEWQKSAGGYTAKVTASEVEQGVLRAGDIGEWQYRTSTRQELQTIASQVLAQVPRADLEKPDGVPLSQVPGLIEQLQRNRQMDLALSLIQDWSATSPFLLHSCVVRVLRPVVPGPLPATAPALAPHLVVGDSQGRVVADLGEAVVPKPPVPGAK